jgi:serine/threonine protein phosphatase PrpC
MTARQQREWFAGATDVGLIRTGNEDSWLAEPPLFIVADGLGGHQAGEVASRIAVDVLAEQAPRSAEPHALDDAVQAANLAVIDAAREGKGRSGMGTTLTAVILDGTHMAVSHVGDSRAYLLHDGVLQRVTQDHSMVADMIREGTLTEEEARYHPNRSVITRALGTQTDMLPDTFEVDAARGDRLLLCSDGLHAQVTDPEIAEILINSATPSDAAKALVTAANDAGGIDNVTVVIVDIADGADKRASGPVASAETTANLGEVTRVWLARGLWVVAAIGVLAVAWFGFQWWAFSQAFLRASAGEVVIYQGVPQDFAGISLSRIAQPTGVLVEKLPENLQQLLTAPSGIHRDSLADARATVAQYQAQISSAPSSPVTPSVIETATPPSVTTTP